MHKRKILPVLLLAWCSATAAPSTAILLGPDEVPLSGSIYPLSKIPFELEIRWQEEAPLELDLYLSEESPKAGGHFVTFSFRDSSGKEAQVADIVGTYLPAQGEIRVFKGQTIKIGLTGHGWATVLPDEKYTLTAVLHGRLKDQIVTIEGRKDVIFLKSSPAEENKPNQVPEPTSGLAPGRGSS